MWQLEQIWILWFFRKSRFVAIVNDLVSHFQSMFFIGSIHDCTIKLHNRIIFYYYLPINANKCDTPPRIHPEPSKPAQLCPAQEVKNTSAILILQKRCSIHYSHWRRFLPHYHPCMYWKLSSQSRLVCGKNLLTCPSLFVWEQEFCKESTDQLIIHLALIWRTLCSLNQMDNHQSNPPHQIHSCLPF